jgi:putative sigma-54 modulation protein
MDLKIQSIHFDATEKLQAFITKKVAKFEKTSDIQKVEVILKVVKPETVKNKDASIKVSVPNGDLFVEKICDTFEEAVDECVEAMLRQVSKYKDKQRTR